MTLRQHLGGERPPYKTTFRSVFILCLALLAGCATPVSTLRTRCTVAEEPNASMLLAQFKTLRGDSAGEKTFVDSFFDSGADGLDRLACLMTMETGGNTADVARVSQLVAALASSDYSRVRRAISALYSMGPAMEPTLRLQLESSADPMTTILLQGVIGCWQSDLRVASRLQRMVATRIDTLDDPQVVGAILDRVITVLQSGRRLTATAIVGGALRKSAQTGNDGIISRLTPLLDCADASVSVFVVRSVGSGRDNRFFPALLLDALHSDRAEVVEEAIRWSPNCWDSAKSELVHRCLQTIFAGQNENLRFQACFPLMHGYGDRDAVAYLLSQTQSRDRARAERAIGWIGDACNSGKPASPELLQCLVPLLESNDSALRRVAADALGTYSGESVITNLIRMLGDGEQTISSEARRKLLDQRDKAMLKRLLSETAVGGTNEVIASKARELLKELDDVGRKPNNGTEPIR
jgi:hypothetical protein